MKQTKMGEAPNAITVVSAIRKIDPNVKCGSDEWIAYAVLLASAVVGANEVLIAHFMDLDLPTVKRFGQNLRTAHIWQGAKIYADWFNEESGGMELATHACVALGYMERASA